MAAADCTSVSKHGQILHWAFLMEGAVKTSSLHFRKPGPAASSHAGPRQRSFTRGLRVVVTALHGKRVIFNKLSPNQVFCFHSIN